MTGRVLVAGIGNIFLSDDGFGVEVVRRLQERGGLPEGVEIVDVGIRGMHLAYQLLDGYDALVLVDATRRGGAPGTIYALEHDLDAPTDGTAALDAHGMEPGAVLALLDGLAASMGIERPVDKVLVVGCEPGVLDEAIGLSAPVAAAVEPALELVVDLTNQLLDNRILTWEGTLQ
ncbi:MAG: hydrogenase maturation protease [Pseudonocardia sp.]